MLPVSNVWKTFCQTGAKNLPLHATARDQPERLAEPELDLVQLLTKCRPSSSLRSKRFRRASAFCPREKWGESKNRKEGVGEGSEGNACGQTPWFWKPPFASERSSWLAGLVKHYWHVSIMCRKERSKLVYKTSRNEYLVVSFGRNPVVQCERFGISKPDYYCSCNCDTICSCSFNFNITFLNVDSRQGRDNKPRNGKFALLRGKTEWFRLACFVACLRILSCRYSDISLEAFLLKEFRTSWYNSEWFVFVSRGMPIFICLSKHLVFSSTRIIQTRLEYALLSDHPCSPSF